VRVVVVGASSGLGRCIGIGLARRGATVTLMARRADRLARAVEEAGPRAAPVVCDITDEDSCSRAVAEAADAMGGIDGIVFASAVQSVCGLEHLTAAEWSKVFATNVIGPALMTARALPYLRAARGTAVYLSSVSASLTPPWPGISGYVTSKAALDKMVEAWRWEHPDIGFTRLAVGECAGGAGESATEFGADQDQKQYAVGVMDWMRRGYMTGDLIDPDDLVHTVDALLRLGSSSSIPVAAITPRVPLATQLQEV
jgi:NAD(P)-dependent dehydrogenase (short-subunit alcohol dehydrogenase family)